MLYRTFIPAFLLNLFLTCLEMNRSVENLDTQITAVVSECKDVTYRSKADSEVIISINSKDLSENFRSADPGNEKDAFLPGNSADLYGGMRSG